MIPVSRRVRPVEPESDIPTRLAHLRAEQRNRPRTILTANLPFNSPSRTTAFLLSDLTQPVESHPTVGLPPSWASSVKRPRSDSPAPASEIERRRRLLSLIADSRTSTSSSSTPTLSESILRLVAKDLGSPTSIYREYLSWIPHHIRIRILDIAALWAPLNEASVLAVLAVEGDQDSLATKRNGEESVLEGEEMGIPTRRRDEEGWEELHDRIDFRSLSSDIIYPFFLTSLNLSFSSISLSGLRQLLLAPTPSPTAKARGTISISLFPHLETLKLASMPNITIGGSLFDILASLLRLQHLSLAGNLEPPRRTASYNTIGTRLALATPHLVSIDLAEMNWILMLFYAIDLTIKWRDLKWMGIRKDVGLVECQLAGLRFLGMAEVTRMRRTRWIEMVE